MLPSPPLARDPRTVLLREHDRVLDVVGPVHAVQAVDQRQHAFLLGDPLDGAHRLPPLLGREDARAVARERAVEERPDAVLLDEAADLPLVHRVGPPVPRDGHVQLRHLPRLVLEALFAVRWFVVRGGVNARVDSVVDHSFLDTQ